MIALSCPACGPGALVQTTETRHHRVTTGLAPPPSGPRATGPLVREGHVAGELGATAVRIEQGSRVRAEGEPGNVFPRVAPHGRLAVRASRTVELGLDAQYLSLSNAAGGARDADAADLSGDGAWMFGPQFRWQDRDGDLLYGVVGEIALGRLPFRHTTRKWTTITDYSTDPPTVVEQGPTVVRDGSPTQLVSLWRMGAELGWSPVPGAYFGAGGFAVGLPLYRDAEWGSACQFYERASRCSEDAPDWDSRAVVAILPYLVGGYGFDRFTLLGQVFATTGSQLDDHVPWGGQLILRAELGLPDPGDPPHSRPAPVRGGFDHALP